MFRDCALNFQKSRRCERLNRMQTYTFLVCVKQNLTAANYKVILKVHGFQNPFRKDNHINDGRNILVYVRDQIMAKRREDLENLDVACLWLEITPNKGTSFLIGSLYRNPTEG